MPSVLFSIPFALLSAYVLCMSLAALALFAADKSKAKRQRRRIPERTLLWVAFLGGAPGAWIGMILFRHKTRHARFNVLVPLALLLWIGILCLAARLLSPHV